MDTQQFLQYTRLRCLYHFTDVENIPLIQQHGLLSLRELRRRDLAPPKPGGNQWSHEEDTRRRLDAYVHLCLIDNHPMEFVARQEGHIGRTRYLRVSTDVLHVEDVHGCAVVANKSGSRVLPLDQALDEFDLEILFGNIVDFQDPVLRDRYNEAKKAEILVPRSIPITQLLDFR